MRCTNKISGFLPCGCENCRELRIKEGRPRWFDKVDPFTYERDSKPKPKRVEKRIQNCLGCTDYLNDSRPWVDRCPRCFREYKKTDEYKENRRMGGRRK